MAQRLYEMASEHPGDFEAVLQDPTQRPMTQTKTRRMKPLGMQPGRRTKKNGGKLFPRCQANVSQEPIQRDGRSISLRSWATQEERVQPRFHTRRLACTLRMGSLPKVSVPAFGVSDTGVA